MHAEERTATAGPGAGSGSTIVAGAEPRSGGSVPRGRRSRPAVAVLVRLAERLPFWAAVLPAGFAAVLFGWGVGTPAYWLDEAATVQDAGRPLPSLLSFLGRRDGALGVYYLLMHGWLRLGDWLGFGEAEGWVRLPSLVAVVLAVALVADLARRRWGSAVGLVAGLLVALLPSMSRYAQEARPTAWAILLATLGFWLLDRAVERDRRRWWIGYACSVAALGLVQLTGLVVLIGQVVLLVASRPRTPGQPAESPARPVLRGLRWMAFGLVPPTALLAFVTPSRATVGWIPRSGLRSLGEAYGEIVGGVGPLLVLGILGLVGLGAPILRGRMPSPVRLGSAAWFVLPPALLGLAGSVIPIFLARYLTVCAPGLALLAAAGLRSLGLGRTGRSRSAKPAVGRAIAVAVAVAAVGALAVVAAPSLQSMRAVDGHGPDARSAGRIVAASCAPGTALREGVATVRAVPYYVARFGCGAPWIRPDRQPARSVARIWVISPSWQRSAPNPGSHAFARVRDTTVSGLRLTLWSRVR